jgi:hypothetical protein
MITFHPIISDWIDFNPGVAIDFPIPELFITNDYDIDENLQMINRISMTPEIKEEFSPDASCGSIRLLFQQELVQLASARVTAWASDSVTFRPHFVDFNELFIELNFETNPQQLIAVLNRFRSGENRKEDKTIE